MKAKNGKQLQYPNNGELTKTGKLMQPLKDMCSNNILIMGETAQSIMFSEETQAISPTRIKWSHSFVKSISKPPPTLPCPLKHMHRVRSGSSRQEAVGEMTGIQTLIFPFFPIFDNKSVVFYT